MSGSLRCERDTVARFDLVLAVSEADCSTLQRLYGDVLRAAVFPIATGVDTAFFAPQDTPVEKRLVFTGSMAPAKLRNSDAFFNAGCAIIAVQTLPPGTYIVMNGRIVDPSKAVKNRNKLRFEET